MQAYTLLRQRYLDGGESMINLWHHQLEEQRALEDQMGQKGKRSKANVMLNIRRLIDPSNPVCCVPCATTLRVQTARSFLTIW